MKTQSLFLTAFIVTSGLVFAQTQDQINAEAVLSQQSGYKGIGEQFRNLFDSLRKNDRGKAESLRDTLEQEAKRDEQTFDSVKEDLQLARSRHLYKEENAYPENDDSDEKAKEYIKREIRRKSARIEKLVRERHRTEKNTSLDIAWRTHEIQAALLAEGFNYTHCKERHWKKYLPENKKEDGKFRRMIRRLCLRLRLPTDADRLEAHRRYLAQVARKFKFDEMVKLILTKLSGGNETQESMLNKQAFVIEEGDTNCYWKIYYYFAQHCADPYFDFRVQGLRNIFANACRAPWLNEDKIKQSFAEVCTGFDLYV